MVSVDITSKTDMNDIQEDILDGITEMRKCLRDIIQDNTISIPTDARMAENSGCFTSIFDRNIENMRISVYLYRPTKGVLNCKIIANVGSFIRFFMRTPINICFSESKQVSFDDVNILDRTVKTTLEIGNCEGQVTYGDLVKVLGQLLLILQ